MQNPVMQVSAPRHNFCGAPTPSRRDPTLDLLRVLAIFCVMLVHTPQGEPLSGTKFIKQFLAPAGVPTFFLLSGYLSARKIRSRELGARTFFLEKFWTLMVPFLAWNLLTLGAVFAIKRGAPGLAIMGSGSYLNIEPTPEAILRALFGIGRFPVAFQLWFLRDLILVSFTAFLLYRLLPSMPLIGWLIWLIPLPIAESLGLFLIGVELRGWHLGNARPHIGGAVLFIVLWIAILVATFFGYLEIPHPIFLVGSAAFLFFVAALLSRATAASRLAGLGPATFFVFAAHEPLQTIFFKLWQRAQWPGYGTIVTLLLVPLLVFGISLMMGKVMSRISPRLYSVLTGGR